MLMVRKRPAVLPEGLSTAFHLGIEQSETPLKKRISHHKSQHRRCNRLRAASAIVQRILRSPPASDSFRTSPRPVKSGTLISDT